MLALDYLIKKVSEKEQRDSSDEFEFDDDVFSPIDEANLPESEQFTAAEEEEMAQLEEEIAAAEQEALARVGKAMRLQPDNHRKGSPLRPMESSNTRSKVGIDLTDPPSDKDVPEHADVISISSESDVMITGPMHTTTATKTTEAPSKRLKKDHFSPQNPYALNPLSDSEDGNNNAAVQTQQFKTPNSIRDFVEQYRSILGPAVFDELVRRARVDISTMCALSEKSGFYYSYPGLDDAQKERLRDLDATFKFSSSHKRLLNNKRLLAPVE